MAFSNGRGGWSNAPAPIELSGKTWIDFCESCTGRIIQDQVWKLLYPYVLCSRKRAVIPPSTKTDKKESISALWTREVCSFYLVSEGPWKQSIIFPFHDNKEQRDMCSLPCPIAIQINPQTDFVAIFRSVESWKLELVVRQARAYQLSLQKSVFLAALTQGKGLKCNRWSETRVLSMAN